MTSFVRSWYTSWLPSLPSFGFTLPSSLQGKFISFLLRRSLGNFLRPGQLDSRQIDSQIGSGFVQINDLELDSEAINTLLSDLPVVLHDGYISSVTARVPWPNPLTSTLGFSASSVHLTFHLLPSTVLRPTHHADLAQSVASVADSFIHEELLPQDQEALWESFRSDLDPANHSRDGQTVPGGLVADPFLSNPEEVLQADTDPDGVSVFASLIERLLARFQFDAVNTKLTLVHPGNMSITLSVDKIRYYTTDQSGSPDEHLTTGQSRILSITGLKLHVRNLLTGATKSEACTPTVQSPFLPLRTPFDLPHGSQSPASSSSSLDEETQFAMSQSLAFLPPRENSPTSTVSGSMYQSAVSTAPLYPEGEESFHQQLESTSVSVPHLRKADTPINPEEGPELLMSFGESPIVIQVDTPSTSTASPQQHSKSSERLRFSLSVGLIASVLRPWHISGLSRLVENLSPPSRNYVEPQLDLGLPFVVDIEVVAKFRGLVVILPLSPSIQQLAGFFESPLVPPPLSTDYFRLFLETLSASLSCLPKDSVVATDVAKPTRMNYSLALAITLEDISLFFMNGSRNPATPQSRPLASPIVITDPGLISQYSRNHHHPSRSNVNPDLPTFEVLDWTSEKFQTNGLKLSLWRTKLRNHGQQGNALDFKPPFAVSITFQGKETDQHEKGSLTNQLEITVVPLLVFVDMEIALRRDGILTFVKNAFGDKPTDGISSREQGFQGHNSESETPFTSPRVSAENRSVNERQRLENLAIEDLSLSQAHGIETNVKRANDTPEKPQSRQYRIASKISPWPRVEISIKIAMIRVQVRCPSSFQRQSPQRSGALVADLCTLRLFNTQPPVKRKIRFEIPELTEQTEAPQLEVGTLLLGADCERIIVACSQIEESLAESILSVGPLGSMPDTQSIEEELPLLPRLTMAKPSQVVERSTAVVLSLDLPSFIIDISKSSFNRLQYWADDVTQLIQGIANGDLAGDDYTDEERFDSRDTSILGSRFFAKSRSGSASATSATPSTISETAIKITISEAFVRAMIPRKQHQQNSKPLIVYASDLDISLQAGAEGKAESIITLGVMDMVVNDVEGPDSVLTFISLTSPRNLVMPSNPMIKLRFSSSIIPGTIAKESRIELALTGFTFTLYPDFTWTSDLLAFAKPPPGAFESVIASERTRLVLTINDGAILAYAPNHPGVVVFQFDDLEFATDVVGESPDSSFRLSIPAFAFLAIDDSSNRLTINASHPRHGVGLWTSTGFALIAEVADLSTSFTHSSEPLATNVLLDRIRLGVHICADTLSAVTAFVGDLSAVFKAPEEGRGSGTRVIPAVIPNEPTSRSGLMASVDDLAFRKVPEIGPIPDMIDDDLPTNPDYLDQSFGAAAGLRELRDDDLDDFYTEDSRDERVYTSAIDGTGVVSRFGGETIKVFHQEGLQIKENYFNNLPPDTSSSSDELGGTASTFRLRIHNGDVTLSLYDGFDWVKTRRIIEKEAREMRRRLAKIRQLVASGQVQEPSAEETSALLFNSVYIGLDQDVDGLEPNAIIAAIDEELKDDIETASQSSWQSLEPPAFGKTRARSVRIHGKKLTRSRGPSMEFCLFGLDAEVDHYLPEAPLVARTFATVRDIEILDHIKTSTWKKFLTQLRSDSRGNIRETDSNMLRIELLTVHPVPGHPAEEARLRAKILPLRLYVDQDAVDFLKSFFSFKDPYAQNTESNDSEIYFQLAEVFPVDLKLDYKPRRVDYRALREGRTIELMNFFHFDGAEMTLRHITLAGITGWSRFFELLNDLWTPDVKATQLVDVISGVAPIRSVVNVGSGVADLVLLPIAQYKKDGRIVRGVQKGATAFVKSTAVEAIKLGARLATGTQVILEQAEGVLGGQFSHPITAEPILSNIGDDFTHLITSDDEESADLISKYAQQPTNIKEGVQSAYDSLRRNFSSAAQTILAVPMEVYERSGDEGPVRSVIRAVPIAVLKPMIGASEAVSKTLLGLHNTLDPNARHDNEAKYKHP